MSYLTKNSHSVKKIDPSFKKYTKILKKHISRKNIVRWKTNRINNIPKLENWYKTLYSHNSDVLDLNSIPDKIFLLKKTIPRGNNNYLFKKLSLKDKEIMASKILEKEETSTDFKKRQLKIKKQILNNIIFSDISGTTHKLSDYYISYSKIPNKISHKKIIEIVKKLFSIKYPKLSVPYSKFSIDFNSELRKGGFLFKLRSNSIKIIVY